MSSNPYKKFTNLLSQELADHGQKRLGKKIISLVLFYTATQIWWAQLVVWGLSMFHVSSGIWPIWLIMEGISSMIVACFTVGMMSTTRYNSH